MGSSDQLQFVQGPAGRLAYVEGGAGTSGLPVVLVHGMASNHEVWRAQVEQLSRSRRVVALSLRGMGASDRDSQGRYGPEAHAEDIASVVDALGIRRFVLVGHSYSGLVISAYAGKRPETVAGLLYVDATGSLRMFPPAEVEGYLASLGPETYEQSVETNYRAILEDGTEATKREVLAAMKATPRDVFVKSTEAGIAFDAVAAVQRCAAPRHAIAVERFVDPSAAHVSLPDVTHEVMTGTSHWPMLDKPAELGQRLESFIERVERAQN